ncbi:MAG: DUF1501 domain-containing protein [Leptospiraceae bacterium]|nr:DUF1501 domain-containing protein [Leptospiraceae bacterium]
MNRKEFLKLLGLSGLALSGIGSFSGLSANTSNQKTLIHLMLEGGPDWRHLFVPTPSEDTNSYSYKFWNNRVTSMGKGSSVNNPAKWKELYNKNYEQVTLSGITFGILKDNNGKNDSNTWLRSMIKAGKVAIIHNVLHSTSRDHAHSRSIIQTGVYETLAGSQNAGGWGGRLITELAGGNTGNANLISLSSQVRQFCNTTNKQNILSFTDSRDFGLYLANMNNKGSLNVQDRGIRALNQYYRNLESGIGSPNLENTVYSKFVKQWSKVGELTESVRKELPSSKKNNLSEMYSDSVNNLFKGNGKLSEGNFAHQIRNLIDAFKVQDILKMRVVSMNYGGWDTHKNQISEIEPQFEDMFGKDKAFETLFKELPSIWDTTSIVISGDFGRQLKSNGDGGTDHGRGNTVLVIGGPVKGGVYGEMFPEIEASDDGSGKSPLEQFNRDIEGRTMVDHVYGRLCTWIGAKGVFANPIPSTIKNHTNGIENGVNLNFI